MTAQRRFDDPKYSDSQTSLFDFEPEEEDDG